MADGNDTDPFSIVPTKRLPGNLSMVWVESTLTSTSQPLLLPLSLTVTVLSGQPPILATSNKDLPSTDPPGLFQPQNNHNFLEMSSLPPAPHNSGTKTNQTLPQSLTSNLKMILVYGYMYLYFLLVLSFIIYFIAYMQIYSSWIHSLLRTRNGMKK